MPTIYSVVEMIDVQYRNGDGTHTGHPVTTAWIPLGSYTPLDPADYDGTCTFTFEIAVLNCSYETNPAPYKLVNVTTGATMATLNAAPGGTTTAIYFGTFVPTAGPNVYAVEIPPPDNDDVNYYGQTLLACRIGVLQTGATKFVQSVPLTAPYSQHRYYTNAAHYHGYTAGTTYGFGSRSSAGTKTYVAWKPNLLYSKLIKAELQAAAFGSGVVALMDYDPVTFEDYFFSQTYKTQTPVASLTFTEATTTVKSVAIPAAAMDYTKYHIAPIKATAGTFYLDKARLNLYYQGIDRDILFVRTGGNGWEAKEQASRPVWNGSVRLQLSGALGGDPYNLAVLDHEANYTGIGSSALTACGEAVLNAPNTEVVGSRTAVVASVFGSVYQSDLFAITSGHVYALAAPECPRPVGLVYNIYDYCYAGLFLLSDADAPPPAAGPSGCGTDMPISAGSSLSGCPATFFDPL